MPTPPIGNRIRARLDELDVERRIGELAAHAEEAVAQGMKKAGELAHEHRDDIDRVLDRAAGAVDRRTDGKHATGLGKLRAQLDRGVDRLAERRPEGK